MRAGIVDLSYTLIFQIINTLLIIGIIWGIFYLIFKLPKKLKALENDLCLAKSKIDELENRLNQLKQ
ncbi:hypothetical protein HNQ80_003379 [Anaerosolibacter carboniphilus]|uniref:Uncharacterized protein n=1 Tax=Anaerosolibacter carboniphilus TaxID=1417629 RepID=A0A841KZ60_9FIRM|nr:hypothetical protein [Anaerosolibacter carboniphilus]MBB6217260.1 hypothetical protein [Anaerosolibacter carboniphilus]